MIKTYLMNTLSSKLRNFLSGLISPSLKESREAIAKRAKPLIRIIAE